MDENKASTPEPTLSPGKLTGLVVAAVILGAGIWGLLASITNNLLVPLLARVMEVDPQSPLYLGKGEFNIPALLSSVLALCLAGIVFALLLQWSRKKPAPVQVKMVRVPKTVSQPTAGPLSITPSFSAPPAPVVAPAPTALAPPRAQPVAAQPAPSEPAGPQSAPTPPAVAPQISPIPVPAPPAPVQAKPPSPPAAPKPTKPQPPKPVYYNIVGEPINPTEDD